MLRQLARLTRPVPAAGPRALALAIYSGPDGDHVPAPGEGVACVDDSARAVELLLAVWQATGSAAIRLWAAGLLDFVLWMHQGDGTWANFITDWKGTVDLAGPTSRPGVNFWQARAVAAAVAAGTLWGDEGALAAANAGFEAADAGAEPDVRALHVLALARRIEAGDPRPGASAQLAAWAEQIASTRSGDVLLNYAGEAGHPHLWGHVQEAALAAAARVLDRPDLLAVAGASAIAVFEGPIRSGFDLPRTQPYDVQSGVVVMDALGAATDDDRYYRLAGFARQWFAGRNPAGSPVYDRATGAVADGIDSGRVNPNSGAESNIAGALALMPAAIASAAAAESAARAFLPARN